MAITSNSSGDFLNISVNDDDIKRLVRDVLSPAAMKRVQNRAINETGRWIKSQLSRTLPALTGIPRKALANRIKQLKTRESRGKIIGKVWLGSNPIDAMALKDGGPVNTGYTSGDYYFEGGFKAFHKSLPSKTGIYARVIGAPKRLQPSIYGRGKAGRRLMQPIKRQGVNIDSHVGEAVRRLIPQAERQLHQKTMRLVKFELEKAAR